MRTPLDNTVAATPPSAFGATKQRTATVRRRWTKERATPYLLILPATLLILLVQIGPMIAGIVISLFKLTRLYIANWANAPFAGLDNYRVALDFSTPIGQKLVQSFLTTLLYTIIVVGVCWLIGTSAAIVLQRSFRGQNMLRTFFLLPYALPAYASIITWSFMLQRDNGVVNNVLVNGLHLFNDPPFWLLGNNSFVSMAVIAIWHRWPFAFLMILAGMQSIPEDVYQASAIDGASVWQQIRYITLGMLRPVNFVLLLMMFLWSFNDFNTPFVLFGPTAPPQSNLLSIHIYDNSFLNWNFGLGSAMSVLLLISLALVSGALLLWNRRSQRA
jgi:multiple sugar transport system permease protein